ncbi:unnamed protein product [Pedinophyceae sp. YPF-701]|nr:unnamed protein product [Pedinophyceae sp. YPF-701]
MTEKAPDASWAEAVEKEKPVAAEAAPAGAPDAAAKAPPAAGVDDDGPPPGFGSPKASGTDTKLAGGIDKLKVEEGAEAESKKVEVSEGTTEGQAHLYRSELRWEDLNLSEDLLKGLYKEMGFERPSKIQAQALPLLLHPPYKNLIAQAHNGSGKTTCFVVTMLARVDPALAKPQALCACPTRELVVQNLEIVRLIGKHMGGVRAISTAEADGMERFKTRRPPPIDEQIVVGTLGRLRTWSSQLRCLSFEDIRVLVFDEADQMLGLEGQGMDSARMLSDIRRKSKDFQMLLFSATFTDTVMQVAEREIRGSGRPYETIVVKKEELSLDVIKQFKVRCPADPAAGAGPEDAKIKFLKDIFPLAENLCQTVVFVREKVIADRLAAQLKADGYSVSNLHGGFEKSQRDQIVKSFKDGQTKILITTDVLARGFDVSAISLVINFHLPTEGRNRVPAPETYLHRIGRSGRFGKKGAAFNLLLDDAEAAALGVIERHFNHPIKEVKCDDEDSIQEILKEAGLA